MTRHPRTEQDHEFVRSTAKKLYNRFPGPCGPGSTGPAARPCSRPAPCRRASAGSSCRAGSGPLTCVERDLDDQLGPQLDPLELAVLASSGSGRRSRARRSRRARACRRARASRSALKPDDVADDAQLAVGVVEAEDQRADRARLLARPPADDDRVDRAHALDLDHPVALARAGTGASSSLAIDALGAAQPRLGLVAVARRPVGVSSTPASATSASSAARRSLVGQLEQRRRRRARAGRRRRSAPASPRRAARSATRPGGSAGRAASKSWRRRRRRRRSRSRRRARSAPAGSELGEVAQQRLAVARLEVELVAVDERDRAEAVPLRLVGPARRRSGSALRERASWGSSGGVSGKRHRPRSLSRRRLAQAY